MFFRLASMVIFTDKMSNFSLPISILQTYILSLQYEAQAINGLNSEKKNEPHISIMETRRILFVTSARKAT